MSEIDAAALCKKLETIEFTDDRAVAEFGKTVNQLGRALHLLVGMRAEELQGVLGEYKGHWYEFGVGNKLRAKLVAAHLKVGVEGLKIFGISGSKMRAAFNRHFVQPEMDARREQQRRKKGFRIEGDDAA